MSNYQSENDEQLIKVIMRVPHQFSNQELRDLIKEEYPDYDIKHIDELIIKGIFLSIQELKQNKTISSNSDKIMIPKNKSKVKYIWRLIFGEYFIRCLFISIAVAIVTARFFRQPDYYYNDQPVSKSVYEHWAKYISTNTRVDIQQLDFVSGIIYGVGTLIISIVISKINFNRFNSK